MLKHNFLNTHLQIIEKSDTEAARYWNSLANKEEYIAVLMDLGSEVSSSEKNLDLLHYEAKKKTSAMFIEVQEKPFEYSRIRKDWYRIASSQYEKELLFKSGESYLDDFLKKHKNVSARYYGGIKSESSIIRKLSQQSIGNAVQQNVLDLWDIVRFKVVVDSLDGLLYLTKAFWKENITGIVRCRNYYYSPRQNSLSDTYRAIHFELADDLGSIIEIQFLTNRREVISTIDHPFTFKKILHFMSNQHRQWLIGVSKIANIHDAKDCV